MYLIIFLIPYLLYTNNLCFFFLQILSLVVILLLFEVIISINLTGGIVTVALRTWRLSSVLTTLSLAMIFPTVASLPSPTQTRTV